jgi:hypothetical protein
MYPAPHERKRIGRTRWRSLDRANRPATHVHRMQLRRRQTPEIHEKPMAQHQPKPVSCPVEPDVGQVMRGVQLDPRLTAGRGQVVRPQHNKINASCSRGLRQGMEQCRLPRARASGDRQIPDRAHDCAFHRARCVTWPSWALIANAVDSSCALTSVSSPSRLISARIRAVGRRLIPRRSRLRTSPRRSRNDRSSARRRASSSSSPQTLRAFSGLPVRIVKDRCAAS